jgi:hypothetical protein
MRVMLYNILESIFNQQSNRYFKSGSIYGVDGNFEKNGFMRKWSSFWYMSKFGYFSAVLKTLYILRNLRKGPIS